MTSTAELLFERRPELYRLIVELLQAGYGLTEIARITEAHRYTVDAVMRRESGKGAK